MAPPTVPDTNLPSSVSSALMPSESTSSQWSVEQVVAGIPAQLRPPAQQPTTPIPYFHLLQRLKTTKREGWRRFGIAHGESISDHMYRMAMITMLAPSSLSRNLDLNKCTRMALIHDVAESLVGDITPVEGVPKDEKNRRESTTMDYICSTLLGNVDGGVQGAEIRRTWQEYEDSKTPESIFVHDVDKIELILQMVEYEKTYAVQQDEASRATAADNGSGAGSEGSAAKRPYPFDLGEFMWVAGKIKSDPVREWARALLQERVEFWSSRGETSIKNLDMQLPTLSSHE